MSKTIIEVKCTDQVLTFVNTPVIASGGVGEDYVSIEFCSMWSDYAKTVLFWRKGIEPIPVLEDEEGLFQVPPELTGVEDIVYFGAVGYTPDGYRRTSEAVSYRLKAGAITEGAELPAPDGDVFDQLMAYYADVKLYVATRIDDAARFVEAAGENVEASRVAAENAEKLAKDAAASVESIIYPGVVQAVLNDGSNAMKIPLDVCPPEKMLLTFRAPFNDGTVESLGSVAIYISYTDDDGTETKESFWLRDGYQSAPPSTAVSWGDVVTVLLFRSSKNEAYVLNSRITQTTLDEMNRRLHSGIPASVTEGGTMTVSLDYVPEDKMVLVFQADEASSAVTTFQLEYEDMDEGLVQVEYTLCDGKDSPVSEYAFYQGDYVVALLTPADKRATVLNPRVSRNALNAINSLVSEVNALKASAGAGNELVEYTGTGSMYLQIPFNRAHSVVQVESVGLDGYYVSAVLFKNQNIAKLRVFADGNSYEMFVSLGENVAWDKIIVIDLTSTGILPEHLNRKSTVYAAIGIV